MHIQTKRVKGKGRLCAFQMDVEFVVERAIDSYLEAERRVRVIHDRVAVSLFVLRQRVYVVERVAEALYN